MKRLFRGLLFVGVITVGLTGCRSTANSAEAAKEGEPVLSTVPPPSHVQGVQHDSQAVRLTWDFTGNGTGYNFYAARDTFFPKFHKENEVPIYQNFLIWDAPFDGTRKFIFYLIAVDKDGHESMPSQKVRVVLKSRSGRRSF